jgi:hypothetical protein
MKGAPSLGFQWWIDDMEGRGGQRSEMIGQGGRTSHERGPQYKWRLKPLVKE